MASRYEEMLTSIANGEAITDDCICRREAFLRAIANGDATDLPEPICREEALLKQIAENGTGSGGTTIVTEDITITPKTTSQTVSRSSGKYINKVTVPAVTSSIDSNILAENIKKDVSILGVTGILESGTSSEEVEEMYDLVIKTQEEFEAWYTTIDNGTCTANSVLLVGTNAEDPMSEPTFMRIDGKGLKIPNTLHKIVGINRPCIFVNNFIYNTEVGAANNVAGLESLDGNCSIRDIILMVDGVGKCVGMRLFYHVENCQCATGISGSATDSIAFQACSHVNDCFGVSMGVSAKVYNNCSALTNCNGAAQGSETGYSYDSCNIIIGCVDAGSTTSKYNNCTNIMATQEDIQSMINEAS